MVAQQQQRQAAVAQQQQRQAVVAQQQQRQAAVAQQQQRQAVVAQQQRQAAAVQQRQAAVAQQQQRQAAAAQQQRRVAAVQQQQRQAAVAQQQHQSVVQQTNVAELEELLRTAPATQQRRPISTPTTASIAASRASVFPTAANANGTESGRSGSNVQQPPQPPGRSNTSQQQQQQRRSQVTQEQVIVGHFCRHALACLTKLTRDLPNHQQLQLSLKTDIKRLWAQWVDNRITKAALLETVARIVRNSCPAAANINVISEFRSWYHQQLDVQRQNRNRQNPPAPTLATARQATPAAAQQHTQAQLPNYRYTQAQQRVAAAPGIHQQQQALALQQNNGVSPAVHRAAIAQGIGAIGAQQAKISVRGVQPKSEPKQYAAKTIPQKTVASKTVPRTIAKPHPQLNAQVSVQNAAAYAAAAAQQAKARPAMTRPKVMPNTVIKSEAMLSAMANTQGLAGKRLTQPVNLPQYNAALQAQMVAQKKAVPNAMMKKPSPKGKKTLPGTVQQIPTAMMGKVHPHQPRVAHPAMPGVLVPGTVPGMAPPHLTQMRPGAVAVARPAVVVQGQQQQQAPVPDQKKKKVIDMGLNVVDNIVDIDNEQNNLVGEVGQQDVLMGDVEDYSDSTLESSALRDRMTRIMRKHGIDGGLAKEILEMMSLATRERISYVIENVREMAHARVDTTKYEFESKENGPDIYAELEKMREDEQRNLVVQSELRTSKWREEQEELSAREAADKKTDEKSAKEAASAAEQKKKAKAALEKKRAADSSQRFALTDAISGINKKRKKKTTVAPFMLGVGMSSKNGSSKVSGASSAPKVGTVPLGATTGSSVVPQVLAQNAMANAKPAVQRPPIKLEDCLAFSQEDPNMRQSAMVYQWYARLHAPRRRFVKGHLPRR